jgi:hypothetical protein
MSLRRLALTIISNMPVFSRATYVSNFTAVPLAVTMSMVEGVVVNIIGPSWSR